MCKMICICNFYDVFFIVCVFIVMDNCRFVDVSFIKNLF